MSLPVRTVYLAAVTLAGSLVLVSSAGDVVREFPGPLWLLLLVLTGVTGWSLVRLRGVPLMFSLSDAFTLGSALLFGPAAGALTVACDAAVMCTRLNRATATPTRVLFNISAPALAMFIGAEVFFRVSGTGPLMGSASALLPLLPAFALLVAIYFFLSTALVAGAITVGRDVPARHVWREQLLPLWPTHLGGALLAALIVVMVTTPGSDLTLAVVTLPLAVALAIVVTLGARRLRSRSAAHAELHSYAAALRGTADGVILADADDRVTFINTAAERLTGWGSADARGRPVSEVLVTGDAAGPERHDGQPRDALPREYTLIRRDGTAVPIEQTEAQIRDDDGTVSGVIRAFRDIHQRKRLEAERHALLVSEREARAAADAASRTKDEFLATLSHELRTPATAILGWTALLQRGRLDDATAHRALAALDRSARAQATVLNDIVDVSRIVRGTLRLDLRRVHMGETVREALETVEPAAAARRIAVRVEVDPALPVIDADADRVRQVVWNLLSNAVKFAPEGGAVDVTVRQEDDAIAVEVSDNGCGISPEFLPHVFDRFRQEDASDTRTHAGLGLGLSIVRSLVEAHGGTVRADSAGRGRGARFTATFPAVCRHRGGDTAPGGDRAGQAGVPAPAVTVRDAGFFEQLIFQMVRAEPADQTGWQAVMRADGSTFQSISGADRKDVTDATVERARRLVAMLVTQVLEAYGVRPEMPRRWQDRRDPRTQVRRDGGRRAMDFRVLDGGLRQP